MKKLFIGSFLVSLFLFFGVRDLRLQAQASCTATINPDYTTVNNYFNNTAVDGSVVCLNAGTANWSTFVDMSKGGTIHTELRGAGGFTGTCTDITGSCGSAGQTIINVDQGPVIGGYDVTTGYITIDNIQWVFPNTSTWSSDFAIITASHQSGVANLKPWIIHHNDFLITSQSTNYPKVILTAQNGGLIYRNKFVNHPVSPTYVATNQTAVEQIVTGNSDTFWASASTFGSADTNGATNLYVETNYFEGFLAIDANTSARVVRRFNEMHSSSLGGHGYDSSAYGQRAWESYNNNYVCDTTNSLVNWTSHRGGTGFEFNNTYAAVDSSKCGFPDKSTFGPIQLAVYKAKQCVEIAGWPGTYISTVAGTYPISHQVGWGWINGSNQNVGTSSTQALPGGSGFAQALEPAYVFNNTNNTASALTSVEQDTGSCRAMAYSNSSKSSDTKIVMPNGSATTATPYVDVGEDAFVFMSDLVGGTTPTIADSLGNSWSTCQAGTNSTLRLSCWHSRITTGGGDTITISHDSSSAARAAVLIVVRGLTASAIDKNPSVITDNASPYDGPSSGTLSQQYELVLGYVALNGPTTFSGTSNVSDSLDGSNGYARATSDDHGQYNVGINGTTGGSDASIAVVFKAVSATTTESPRVVDTTMDRNGITGTITLKLNCSSIGVGSCLDLQESNFITANREYYTTAGSFDGTTGTGSGTRASRPATCTPGVAYWSTDQGSWNTSGSGGQGVLDKCTSTNTWTNAWYVPYTYPHPLALTGPTLSYISPSSGAQGTIVHVTLTGTGFIP